MRRKLQLMMLVAVIPMALTLIPQSAEAQRGGPPAGGARPPAAARPPGGHPGGGTVVVRGGYYGAPYWGLGWGWGGPWGSYWYGGPYWGYPYPYWGGYYDLGAELRLEVKPKQAQVFLDGYYVGIVDEFDGTFQRLKLDEGPHRIEIRMEGFETLRFDVRITWDHTIKLRGVLQPKAP